LSSARTSVVLEGVVEKEPRLDAPQLEALARRLDSDPTFITRLYELSEVFREITADYVMCNETLERFRHRGRVDDAKMRDYVEMRDQLERELRACLEGGTRRGE
jgi:hypothetical protein